MLISHRYRFIFLKTEKTASTSIFRALRDLVSETEELLPADRTVRNRLLRQYGSLEGLSFESRRTAGRRKLPTLFGLHRHAKARDVRDFIGPKLFDEYTIVTSERNPWDRQVSLYAHRNSLKDRLNLSDFDRDMKSWWYNALHYNRLDNWGIYAIDDQVCADVVIRFEHLADDFRGFLERIGVPTEKASLPVARSTNRPEQVDYRAYYSPETKALVAAWYRKEIAYFGYAFGAEGLGMRPMKESHDGKPR